MLDYCSGSCTDILQLFKEPLREKEIAAICKHCLKVGRRTTLLDNRCNTRPHTSPLRSPGSCWAPDSKFLPCFGTVEDSVGCISTSRAGPSPRINTLRVAGEWTEEEELDIAEGCCRRNGWLPGRPPSFTAHVVSP